MKSHFGVNPAAVGAALRGDVNNALLASTPGGIERQEAEGQQCMVAAQQLPLTINSRLLNLGYQEVFKRLGITMVEKVDDLFASVILPQGWSIKPTDHSVWSRLLDQDGGERGSIFYKAAYYDRSAHLNLSCRYTCRNEYGNKESRVYLQDGKTGQRLHSPGPWRSESDWRLRDEDRVAVAAWLDEFYPLHTDPFAYWDQE